MKSLEFLSQRRDCLYFHNMNTYHTGIAVAVSDAGINWPNQMVPIVFLIVINEKETYLFSEPMMVQKLQSCQIF